MSLGAKVESGAQLLARLGPRPSLHGLGAADLLGFEPSPGDIIEVYGSEGVGKTELLLHLLCHAIIPTTSDHGDSHQSNKTEVVWVDCDLKFSVLRLAVLLEQRIVNISSDTTLGVAKSEYSGPVGDTLIAGNTVRENRSSKTACTSPVVGNASLGYNNSHTDETEKTGDRAELNSKSKTVYSSGKDKSEVRESDTDCAELHSNRASSKYQGVHDGHEDKLLKQHTHGKETSQTESGIRLRVTDLQESSAKEQSAEDVEKKVQEYLGHVHVAHCTSSQQLICTLHSLESLIAANRNISIIIIDSVSAFFWSDKCSDFNHSASFLHKNMSHVAAILEKLAKSYGILVLVSKQALVKPWTKELSGSVMIPATGSTDQLGKDNHVEFLGQAWSRAVTHRVICSQCMQRQGEIKKTQFMVTSASQKKQFSVRESGIHIISDAL